MEVGDSAMCLQVICVEKIEAMKSCNEELMHIETDEILAFKVMLSSEAGIAAFKGTHELRLVFSPGVTGFTSLLSGDRNFADS